MHTCIGVETSIKTIVTLQSMDAFRPYGRQLPLPFSSLRWLALETIRVPVLGNSVLNTRKKLHFEFYYELCAFVKSKLIFPLSTECFKLPRSTC